MQEITLDGKEFLIGTDDEATECANERIEDSLWAFNASFLADHLGCPIESVQAIHENDQCEGNNEVFKEWLGDKLDDFKEAAIDADGRGHFIAGYDHEEHEIKIDGEIYYAYRVN